MGSALILQRGTETSPQRASKTKIGTPSSLHVSMPYHVVMDRVSRQACMTIKIEVITPRGTDNRIPPKGLPSWHTEV